MTSKLAVLSVPQDVDEKTLKRYDKITKNLKATLKSDVQAHERNGVAIRKDRSGYAASVEPGGARYWIIEEAQRRCEPNERIAFIAELISDGLWRAALMKPLARAWGLTDLSCRTIASQATRVVSASMGDRDEIRSKCMSFLEVVAHDALENGDRRSAVAAVRTVADLAGLVTKKTEISGPGGGPIAFQDLSQLSDTELEAAIVKAAANAIRANGGASDDASQAVLDAESRLAGDDGGPSPQPEPESP